MYVTSILYDHLVGSEQLQRGRAGVKRRSGRREEVRCNRERKEIEMVQERDQIERQSNGATARETESERERERQERGIQTQYPFTNLKTTRRTHCVRDKNEN